MTVIIVAYRSRAEIGACLGSIPRELSGHAVEVVVVDNSLGADGVPGLIAERFPWVRCIVPEENLGFGRGNNRGFAATTGEYVLFLNPDTEVNELALTHCLQRLGDDEHIGMISPKLVQADGSMDLACRRSIPTLWDGFCRAVGLAAAFPSVPLFSGYNLTHLPEDGSYDVGAINGAFMMGRRSLFEAVAEPAPHAVFDERFFMYGDDLDLCIRVARAGHRIVYDGRVSIIHLKGVSVGRDFDRMSRAIFDANRDVYL
ncbi:MAG: glycosyltransferase family 2 protein, partial [Verrucomicrobia bacterium]